MQASLFLPYVFALFLPTIGLVMEYKNCRDIEDGEVKVNLLGSASPVFSAGKVGCGQMNAGSAVVSTDEFAIVWTSRTCIMEQDSPDFSFVLTDFDKSEVETWKCCGMGYAKMSFGFSVSENLQVFNNLKVRGNVDNSKLYEEPCVENFQWGSSPKCSETCAKGFRSRINSATFQQEFTQCEGQIRVTFESNGDISGFECKEVPFKLFSSDSA